MGQDRTPFFLIGCVRSGTTLLRDLLRQHDRLECPEETHFFRWADPFGTDRFRRMYKKSELMRRHREMDGVDNFDFSYILNNSQNRWQMSGGYGLAYLKAVGNPEGRWFDKTPQNIYGVLLISAAFPDAKYIHIHRHPLNVVASLLEGAVMPPHSLNGAINYWTEAVNIIQQFRKIAGDQLIEVRYDDLTSAPLGTLNHLLEFLDEDPALLRAELNDVHPEKNKYLERLDASQVKKVLEQTARERDIYGYGDIP